MIPSPRGPVANPELQRPDWVNGFKRDPGLLWLDKNENRDPEHLEQMAQILRGLDPAVFSTYPEAQSLYRKLAGWVCVDPHQLVLAAGSDGVIRTVFETYISPGDVVIVTAPTFAMYDVYCKIYGAQIVALAYVPSPEGPLLESREIVASILATHPRLVCVPNPDSPTGTVFSAEEVAAILEAAGRVGAMVLIDEAYFPFYEITAVPLIAMYPNLIVARSTGKAWGLAGVRIGYGVADARVAASLHQVRPMYECSTYGMASFSAMLDHVELMHESVARLEAGKRYFLEAMASFGFRTLCCNGNFMHVAFGKSASAVHDRLSSVCYYRKEFKEPCLQGFSRFSATTVECFWPVVSAISQTMRECLVDGE